MLVAEFRGSAVELSACFSGSEFEFDQQNPFVGNVEDEIGVAWRPVFIRVGVDGYLFVDADLREVVRVFVESTRFGEGVEE